MPVSIGGFSGPSGGTTGGRGGSRPPGPGSAPSSGTGIRIVRNFAKGGKADAHEPTGGKKRNMAKKYAVGGSASKRADGCAVKGKTKGKMV